MKKQIIPAITSLILFSSTPFTSSAENGKCDAGLQPIPGSVGYIPRDGRCEGLYVSPVSAKSLEVISLLAGKLRFDLQPNTYLKVLAPDMGHLANGPVRVRAMALPLETYYRMDALLSPNRPFLWPVGDVLAQVGLLPSRIGIFGWIGTERQKIFVPLHVSQKGKQPSPKKSPVELVIRSPVDVEKIFWRSSVKGEKSSQQIKWSPVITRRIPAGQPVTIVLKNHPLSVLNIEVIAKVPNQERWLNLKINVLYPGSR